MSEKVLQAMADKFATIAALVDAFCAEHLSDEYRQVIHHVVGALARKRPSPLSKGKENVWAAAAVHVVGRVNFLDDASKTPHCKSKVTYEFFGIAESTGQNKSKEIRDLLKMGLMSPEWMLDGFEGKLTSSKWAAIAKCSADTALRDINDLLTRGVLRKADAGGRSTCYELNDLPA